MPTAVAIQCVEVTTPNVPSISGRVVKGLGLMLPAMGLVLSGGPYSTRIGSMKVPRARTDGLRHCLGFEV